MTLLFFVNFVVFKKQFWKCQLSIKSEIAPTNFTFQEYICQVFQKPEANFRNMNFRFLLILHDYNTCWSVRPGQKTQEISFFTNMVRENIGELLASKRKIFLTFSLSLTTCCFFQTIARQRKFSMYWKSFLRSERLGQALFLPSLRATSILSGSLVAAISLS